MDATKGYSEAWLTQSTTNGQKLLILPECLGMVDVQDECLLGNPKYCIVHSFPKDIKRTRKSSRASGRKGLAVGHERSAGLNHINGLGLRSQTTKGPCISWYISSLTQDRAWFILPHDPFLQLSG